MGRSGPVLLHDEGTDGQRGLMYSAGVMNLVLLVSASPRRSEILKTLQIPFQTSKVEVDESELPNEPAEDYLVRVVQTKLNAATALLQKSEAACVLVADTTVVLDEKMLAKPLDVDDNRAMVTRLAGRTHRVMTRFAISTRSGDTFAQTVTTIVRVKKLSAAEIDAYVATGEGRDKAGGYAIQGIGSFAVEGIDGSYTNVVGLPAAEVVAALESLRVLPNFPLRQS